MTDNKEQRLIEALTQYESGVSLATLQMLYADVATDLNNIVEARRALLQVKDEMKPSQELARKIAAGFSLAPELPRVSVFASKLWRFAAPVGVAALSFMFVLSNQVAVREEAMLMTDTADSSLTEPMAAKFAAPEMATFAVPAGESSLMAMDMAAPAPEPVSDTRLYILQMIALGLLAVFSLMVLVAHWVVIRR